MSTFRVNLSPFCFSLWSLGSPFSKLHADVPSVRVREHARTSGHVWGRAAEDEMLRVCHVWLLPGGKEKEGKKIGGEAAALFLLKYESNGDRSKCMQAFHVV